MYRRSPIVIQKQPSVLAQILSGLGFGITQSIQKLIEKKEQKKAATRSVMEKILSGEMPAEAAATDMFQGYVKSAGIQSEPEIQDLIWKGRERFAPEPKSEALPGGAVVTMPSAVPMDVSYEDYEAKMKAKQIKEEDDAWRRAWDRNLKEIGETDQAKSDLVRKNILQNIMAAEIQAKRDGEEIQDKHINWTTGSVSVDYLTDSEKKEKVERKAIDATKIHEADRKAYDTNAKTARLRRTKLMTDLAKIKSGVSTTSDLGDVAQGILGSLPTKSTDPKVIFNVLYREANKEIDEYNKREKRDAKRLKLKPGQRVTLKRISPKLEDVEPVEALGMVDGRNTVNPPPGKPEPTDEEINKEAKTLMESGALDPGTGKPYTLEKAKEIAVKFLKSL